MKKMLLAILLLLGTFSVAANNIRYFTYTQVARTVSYLNNQNELMIYCGYADEIETYVLINEVWAEKVNSKFYEVWLFGYDAYTGEEIYMPIDLQCIWLPGTNNSYYNAAQYLRFRTSVQRPTLVWCMPPYNPYMRVHHVPGHAYTYHWEIHRHDWRRPDWHHSHNTPPPYHPYYMRDPRIELQRPTQSWTPGVDRPTVPTIGYGVRGTSTRQEPSRNSGIRTPEGTVSTNTNRNNGGATTRTGTTGTISRGNSGTVSNGTTTRNSGTTTRSTTTGTTSRSNNNNKSTVNSGTTTRNNNNSGTTTRSTTTSTTSRSSNNNKGTVNSGTTTRNNNNRGTTTRSTTSGTSSRSNTKASTNTSQSSRNTGTVSRSNNSSSSGKSTTRSSTTTTRSTAGSRNNNQ